MQRHMSICQATLGTDAAFEALSPTVQSQSGPSSRCLHAKTREMSNERSLVHMPTCRRAGKRDGKGGKGRSGKQRRAAREEEEYKTGWWTQTETVRESEGHLPPPSGCWVHSLCEGYLSQSGHLRKVGFSRVRKKKKKKKNAFVAKNKSLRCGSEVNMRSEFERKWEGGRVGRLGCRWPEKNKERDRVTGNETGLPKAHSVHQRYL